MTAATPATDVEVNGTYEIFELFGGGNGADDLPDGSPNPGANVGYKDYHLVENDPAFATKDARVNGEGFAEYRYGTGVATVNIKGGKVFNDVYGGGALGHTNSANWNPEDLTGSTYPQCIKYEINGSVRNIGSWRYLGNNA